MKILRKVTTLFRDDTKSPTRTRPIEYHRNSAEDVRPQIVLAPVVPAAAVASSEQQAVRQAAAGVDNADSLAVSDQRLAVEQQIRSRTHREVAAVHYRYQQLVNEQDGILSGLLGRQSEGDLLERKVTEAQAAVDSAEQELRDSRGPGAVEATRSVGFWSRVMQWIFLIVIIVSEVVFNATALLVAGFSFQVALMAGCGISLSLLVGASFTANQLAAGRRAAALWMGIPFSLAGLVIAVSMAVMREDYVRIMDSQTGLTSQATSSTWWTAVALGVVSVLMPLVCGALEYGLFFGATLGRADRDLKRATRALDAYRRQNADLPEQIEHARRLKEEFAHLREKEVAVVTCLGTEMIDTYYVALQTSYGDPEMTTALDQRRAAADARVERARTSEDAAADGRYGEDGTPSLAVA